MSGQSSEESDSDQEVFSPRKTRNRRKINYSENNERPRTKIAKQKHTKSHKRNKIESDSAESSSASSAEEEIPALKKVNKRRKIHSASSSEDEEQKGSSKKRTKKSTKKSKKHGRRKIVKIISEDELEVETKEAEEQERQRLQRLKEKIESSQDLEDVAPSGVEEDVVLQKEPLVKVAQHISKHLKIHQINGIKFIWNNLIEDTSQVKKDNLGNGCILAHCMGLGKTLQTIATLHTILHCKELSMKCVLVVCPLNTVRNWLNEIEMWTGNYDSDILTYSLNDSRTMKERQMVLKRWKDKGGVMVIGYDMFRRLALGQGVKYKPYKIGFKEVLVNPGPDIVVCDEGHMLKNANSNISIEMRKIKTRRRIVLTGTPLQNNLVEYHCMVEFVKPGLLGTLNEFRNRFMNPILNGQHADSTQRDVFLMKKRAHVLHDMLKGFVQRQDYNILMPYLKPKFEYVVKCRLSSLQIQLYQHYLDSKTNKGENENIVNQYGKGTSLFADYQCLMRVWTHPKALFLHTDRVKEENERKEVRALINDELEEEESAESTSEDEEFMIETPVKSNHDAKKNGLAKKKSASLPDHDDKNTRKKNKLEFVKKPHDENSLGTATSSDEENESDNLNSSVSKRSRIRRVTRSNIAVIDDSSSQEEEEESHASEESSEESDSEEESSGKQSDEPKLTRSQRLQRRKKLVLDDNEDEDVEMKELKSIKETTRQWYEDVLPVDNREVELLEHSPKIMMLFEIIKRAEACGDKTLVFSQSLLSLDLIEEYLAICCNLGPNDKSTFPTKHRPGNGQWFRNIDYFRMDGSIDGERRQRWINDFNNVDDKRARLFLISTRAGSLGVNLVAANRVVIFDASWNPTHDTQSMFRVYRFGQTKTCYIYRLIAQGTMEEKIYERQVAKQSLAFRVVDEQQINRYFTANSLAEMYTFKPSRLEDEKDAPVPVVPKDYILADLLSEDSTKAMITSYHEHDSLLDHQESEELTEEERKAAWEEFKNEKDRITRTVIPPPNSIHQPSSSFQFNVNPNSSTARLEMDLKQIMNMISTTQNTLKHLSIKSRYQIIQQLKIIMPNAPTDKINAAAGNIYKQQMDRYLQLKQEIKNLVAMKTETMISLHRAKMMDNSTTNPPMLSNELLQSLLLMHQNALTNFTEAPQTPQPASPMQTQTMIKTYEDDGVLVIEDSQSSTFNDNEIKPSDLSKETKKVFEASTSKSSNDSLKNKKQPTIYDLLNLKQDPGKITFTLKDVSKSNESEGSSMKKTK